MQDLSSVKARSVPYALQKAVDEEYDRLESEGIIVKVEYSDWATPMVHIPKRDVTTRSCGDYSVTVKDVFCKMAGGQRYTKLDIRSAH